MSTNPATPNSTNTAPRRALDVSDLLLTSHVRFIDGLRALAVVSVIVYHMNEKLLRGGYVGVDVFYVISGFVITKSLLYSYGNDKGSVVRFLGSRIRRIFPAAFVVIALTIGATYVLLTYAEHKQFFDQKPWMAFGNISNFGFADVGLRYGNLAEFKNPLLHTWSLGIENQFYLLYPILIVGAFKFLRSYRALQIALMLVFVASFAAYLHQPNINDAFYLPQYRFWQIAAGAIVALISVKIKPDRVLLTKIGVFASFVAIFYFMFTANDTSHPRVLNLLPTLSTAFLLLVLTETSARNAKSSLSIRLLSLSPIAFLGVISYSLYLWHYPIVAFATTWNIRFDSISSPAPYLFVATTLLFGWLSYRFIEQPFRKIRNVHAVFVVGIFLTLGLVFGAKSLPQNHLHESVFVGSHPQVRGQMQKLSKSFAMRYQEATETMLRIADPNWVPSLGGNKYEMLVLGNSHMEQFQLAAAKTAHTHGLRGLFFGMSGDTFQHQPNAERFIEHIFKNNDIRYVMILYAGLDTEQYMVQQIKYIRDNYRQTKILLIKDNPYVSVDIRECKDLTRLGSFLHSLGAKHQCPQIEWDPASLDQQALFDKNHAQLIHTPNVYYIDKYRDHILKLRRPLVPGKSGSDRYMFYDPTHFSKSGYDYIEADLLKEIDTSGAFEDYQAAGD